MTSTHEPAGKAPIDLNALDLGALYRALSGGGLVRRLIELARDEDLGMAPAPVRPGDTPAKAGLGEAPGSASIGDITTMACIGPDARAEAALVARGAGVVAGLAAVPELLEVFATDCRFEGRARDGQAVAAGTVLGTLRGPMDEVLEAERTLLNLIGRLSGIATRASEFVGALAGAGPTRARLYDTRKTTPGLRMLEKYAVRCGGGFCHRIGLYDAVLIKDNHIAVAGGVRPALERARRVVGHLVKIEIEVDTLAQLREVLATGLADAVLLDNMDVETLRQAAHINAGLLTLEASGGVTEATLAAIAATGVDYASSGALTHSAPNFDVALDIETGA